MRRDKRNDYGKEGFMIKKYVEKRYILLPVEGGAQTTKIRFYTGDGEEKKLVFDLDCKLAQGKSDFVACYDAREFLGKKVYFECEDGLDITQSDDKVLPDNDKLRPFVHFTPEVGWNNDPNGMIEYDGVYHMFYQFNPCGRDWGNMHWGHAVSSDMLSWEEKEIALFPDQNGTMFSGSATEDTRNLSGLKKGDKNPLLLFYTAAGGTSELSRGKPFTQRLAYSTDGGKTFIKREGNPIIDFIAEGNRDPKVVWAEEIDAYLLALYLTGNDYALFTSENLLDWTLLQKIKIDGENECPDVYVFKKENKIYRAIIGAADRYVIGEFSDGKFKQITGVKQLNYPGRTTDGLPRSYAAQSFSGTDGRIVRISWHNIGSPRAYGASEMSLPQEITLCGQGKDMYLKIQPAAETEKLYESEILRENIAPGEKIRFDLKKRAYRIEIKSDSAEFCLDAFGLEMRGNAKNNRLTAGDAIIPLDGDKTDIIAIFDKCSVEIYVDGGKRFTTVSHECNYDRADLEFRSGGKTQKLSVIELKNLFAE